MKLIFGAVAVLLAAGLGVRAEVATGIEAVVDTVVITQFEVDKLTKQTVDVIGRQSRTEEEFKSKVRKSREENLDRLVDGRLILHEFKAAGYQMPDSVIDEEVKANLRKEFKDRGTATKTLQARGITYEKYREKVREQIILNAMRSKNISQEIIVSPYKMEKYYKDHADDFKVEDEVKLRAIIIAKGVDDDQAKKLCSEILGKIKEGVSFEEMASTYSQTPDRKDGGARPWQQLKELRKELAEGIKPLKPGQLSDIIETPASFWIVKLDEKRDAYTRPLTEVRDQIEQELLTAERTRLEKAWIAKLKKKTFVGYF